MFHYEVPGDCTGSYDEEGPEYDVLDLTMYSNPSGGTWNNKFSSVETFNKCDVKSHDQVGLGGWRNRAGSFRVS